MKKWFISLCTVSILFLCTSTYAFAVVWEKDEIFAFIQDAKKLQFAQHDKTFSSKKELEDVFATYFTSEFSQFFIQEMYWKQDGVWSVIPTDYFIGYIPPFHYDERTKIDYIGHDIVISEFVPANDIGPVVWDDYVATVTIARTKEGWKIRDIDGYLQWLGVIYVYIDGELMLTDQPPIIQNGRVLVPIRSLFETLDQKVEWNAKTREISINDGEIQLTVGSKMATVRNKNVTLDVPAQVINGRTVVPLRFITENLGKEVKWDPEKRIVDIK